MADEPSPSELPQDMMALLYSYSDRLNAGLFSEADELGSEFMERMGEHAQESLPFNRELQETILATFFAQQGKWAKAEEIYKQRLVRAGRDDHALRKWTCKDLADHHALIDELNLAAMYMAEAVHAMRTDDATDLLLPLWLTLDSGIANRQGRYAAALPGLDEALSCLPDERGWDLLRSQILIGRARSYFGLGKTRKAEADHRDAWELLTPWEAMSGLVGVPSAFAHWWFVEAMLWEQEHDFEQARHAWQQTLACDRQCVENWDEGSPTQLLPLARDLSRYGNYLMRRGEATEAAQCFAESDDIRMHFRLAPFR